MGCVIVPFPYSLANAPVARTKDSISGTNPRVFKVFIRYTSLYKLALQVPAII
jgi:hypothetical protein